MDFQNIFEEFKQAIQKKLHKNTYRIYFRDIAIFINFLKDYELNEINKTTIDNFKSYILELRNEDGFYFLPGKVLQIFNDTKLFLKWLKEKNILSENIPTQKNKDFYNEAVRNYNKRKFKLIDANAGTYSNDEVLTAFKAHIEKYLNTLWKKKYFKRTLFQLKEYSEKSNKPIIELTEPDLSLMIKNWCSIEIYPSMPIVENTLTHMYFILRLFFRFLNEEGFRKDNPILKWTEKDYRQKVSLILKTNKESKIKSRYYSVKEILTAYKKYLVKTCNNFCDIYSYYKHLKGFIRFIVSKNKTIYTTDEQTISEYKIYLLNYEYEPKKYYTAFYQADKLRCIKRFYDWFTNEGYSLQHPLKAYGITEYQKSIENICKEKNCIRESNLDLPENYRRIYEGATAYEKTINLNIKTIKTHERGWKFFFYWLNQTGIENIKEVDEQVLNDFQVYVLNYKSSDGKVLSLVSRIRHLIAVKRLFQYLSRFKYLNHDPSFCIKLPKHARGLPTNGMNHREVKKLLSLPLEETAKTIRDRALIETLYSTGVRRNELRNLKINDIDFTGGLLRVNVPKGGINFQRVIPIGKTACNRIQKYISEVRSRQKNVIKNEYLFLTKDGNQMSGGNILNIVKTWITKANLKKRLGTHSFRVSCATEMLKGKADIKFVQQQLGHTEIASTEKYLRLVPMDLKRVHSKTHPLERKNKNE